jgi:hypothetical protein
VRGTLQYLRRVAVARRVEEPAPRRPSRQPPSILSSQLEDTGELELSTKRERQLNMKMVSKFEMD